MFSCMNIEHLWILYFILPATVDFSGYCACTTWYLKILVYIISVFRYATPGFCVKWNASHLDFRVGMFGWTVLLYLAGQGNMNILCNGDSHIKGFRDFIGHNQDSSDLFNVQNISHVDFFGVSGDTVTNPRHLKTVLAAVHQYQPTTASPPTRK